MLNKKLFRTMKQYKAQFISMIIMIALGIGIFVGFNMEWYTVEKDTDYFYRLTGFADYRVVNDNYAAFTSQDEEKIKSIDGVDETSRYISINVNVKNVDGKSLALTVSKNPKVSFFTLTSGNAYDETSTDGVWLSDKYAKVNKIKIGDGISLQYNGITLDGKVEGLVKSSEYLICTKDVTQLMPDYRSFGFCYISPAFYESKVGEYYPQINVLSKNDEGAFKSAVNEKLGKTTLVLTRNEVISYSEVQGEATEGKTMGLILPVVFLLIAVLTMVTTMHRITVKEKTQIGTLKALGYKNKTILRHYSTYALIVGVFGIVLGIAMGYGICYYIMNPDGMMGTYFDMPVWKLYTPAFCYFVLVAILALLVLIGFLSVRKMLKGMVADTLRPYVPTKTKALLIEKTKLWNKLSFGTKWNARDMSRHKSRFFMSLIGVVGCMVILVGSLGMYDTMKAFVSVYYDGAMKYSSSIMLSENATNEQITQLRQDYNADAKQTVAIEFKNETYSLEIYDINNDTVKFIDRKDNYFDIKDGGAYVCVRLADKYNIKVNSTISFSPFGSERVYTVKVAGICRSLTESIVLTKNYAESLSLDFRADCLYTKTAKSQIESTNAIKSIQSKQETMDSFDSFMAIMNTMIYLLIIVGMVLAIVVLYNLGTMGYTERYREMATLKVVGFRNKKIARLLIGQNAVVTLIGVILGLPLGFGVLKILVDKLATEYEMKATISFVSYLLSILLTFAVSLFVGLLVARKNKKIDMVESLKGAE